MRYQLIKGYGLVPKTELRSPHMSGTTIVAIGFASALFMSNAGQILSRRNVRVRAEW